MVEEKKMGQGIYITVVEGKGDNDKVSAYHVAPKQSQPKGGIVLLQEIFGVNEYIREVCDHYAEKGWEVIALSSVSYTHLTLPTRIFV